MRFNDLINFINFYKNIINKILYFIKRDGRLINKYKNIVNLAFNIIILLL